MTDWAENRLLHQGPMAALKVLPSGSGEMAVPEMRNWTLEIGFQARGAQSRSSAEDLETALQ